jgi:hypothetical protein
VAGDCRDPAGEQRGPGGLSLSSPVHPGATGSNPRTYHCKFERPCQWDELGLAATLGKGWAVSACHMMCTTAVQVLCGAQGCLSTLTLSPVSDEMHHTGPASARAVAREPVADAPESNAMTEPVPRLPARRCPSCGGPQATGSELVNGEPPAAY